MQVSVEWIIGVIGTLVTAIGALAGYFAWQNRQIVGAYFEAIPKLTGVLEDLVRQMQTHDQLSCKSHEDQCRTLREISDSLHRLNRNGTGGQHE